MNVAAGPELAAAVTNAGGLGVIGGVGYTPKVLRQQVGAYHFLSLLPNRRTLADDERVDQSPEERSERPQRAIRYRLAPSADRW